MRSGRGHDANQLIEAFAVIDFEASSLSELSWPIEVGLSWIDKGQLRTWSSLIKPDPSWVLNDWSTKSSAIHKIPFRDLDGAPPAVVIAKAFMACSKGKLLVSDAPLYETRWLAKLLATTGPCGVPNIQNYHDVSFQAFDGYALDMLYERLERQRVPHRAGPDSARMVQGWLEALSHVD